MVRRALQLGFSLKELSEILGTSDQGGASCHRVLELTEEKLRSIVPPGVTTMKLMKASIRYAYDEMLSGGRVRITGADPVAVAAIHDFLRFQITVHDTGDNLEMSQK